MKPTRKRDVRNGLLAGGSTRAMAIALVIGVFFGAARDATDTTPVRALNARGLTVASLDRDGGSEPPTAAPDTPATLGDDALHWLISTPAHASGRNHRTIDPRRR